MKSKVLSLTLIVGIAFFTNCSGDDNNPAQDSTINGTWFLKNVHGGLASLDIDYAKGDIKWIFNQTNKTLTVQNNIGNDNGFMVHDGIYDYEIELNGETQVLFLDNEIRMVILSFNNDLIITDDFNDGFTAEFQR